MTNPPANDTADRRFQEFKAPPTPWFTVTYKDGSLMAVGANGIDCLPLYATRELAELFIEQSGDDDSIIKEIKDGAEAIKILKLARKKIASTPWNSTAKPEWMRVVAIDDLLRNLPR